MIRWARGGSARGTGAPLAATCFAAILLASATAARAELVGIGYGNQGDLSLLERPEAQNERVIPVERAGLSLATWDELGADGTLAHWYGVSLDGATFARVAPADYRLGLHFAEFDPLVNTPAIPAELAAGPETGLWIVQFVSEPLPAFNQDIEALGARVRHYLPQFAYLVQMDAAARAEVAALPYVRWVGPYHPVYRLESFLVENRDRASELYPNLIYNIQVHEPALKDVVAGRVRSLGGTVVRADAGKRLVEAALTPEQLFAAANWDEVVFMDRWSPYDKDMDLARSISGANYIESVAGYDGSGVRGEVFDEGFNLGHVDFSSRPLILHGSVDAASHGASTSGIVFGDGTGNPIARGMLPEGQGIVADYGFIGLTGPSRYTHSGQLLQAPYFAVFQTSSVGSDRTTQYTSISADTDDTMFDFDLLHCQSQSNAGNQMSRPQAWAKNILSGGGIYHRNTLDKADDCWCSGASIGPASDGRIKPTLSHFYDLTFTTDCCGPTTYTSSFGGTSGATPIICGHVGLFHEMWADGIFGNEVTPGGSVFDNRPHSTTARAMMINTADQYAFTGLSHDKTRMHQGWGMPSVKNLYDLRDQFFIVDETDVLEPLEIATYAVQVAEGTPALKITMVYLDPAGNPATPSQHRVNDLSLRVTSPTVVPPPPGSDPGAEPALAVYAGNNGLLTGVWSATGNFLDHKNTEECVFIQNPAAGAWKIEVIAEEIIQDSHVETPQIDADYALVVSGVTGEVSGVHGTPAPAPPAMVVGTFDPGSGTAQLLFSLPEASRARLLLHDVRGRLVATLADGRFEAGAHVVNWNATDRDGQRVPAGVYFASLESGQGTASGKLVVVR